MGVNVVLEHSTMDLFSNTSTCSFLPTASNIQCMRRQICLVQLGTCMPWQEENLLQQHRTCLGILSRAVNQ